MVSGALGFVCGLLFEGAAGLERACERGERRGAERISGHGVTVEKVVCGIQSVLWMLSSCLDY